jgi:hypothetical protein
MRSVARGAVQWALLDEGIVGVAVSRAKRKPVRDFSRGGVRVEDGPLADLVRAVGTMPALAEMVGVSASTLRRINQGERAPKKGEALLLATIAKQYRVAAPTFAGGRP